MNAQIKYEYGHFRGVKRCEVKRRSPRGDGYHWLAGTIAEMGGKGAYVVLDAGGRNFFYWSDMRPLQPETLHSVTSNRSALATIGDAVASKPTPAPRAVVAPVAPAPAPPAPQPPAPALPLARRTKTQHAHQPTEIGNAFRALRLAEGTTQEALASLLGCSYNLWSKIELGDRLPDDALLARFAEFSGQALAELKALRDGKPSPAPEPVAQSELAPQSVPAQVLSDPEPVNDAGPAVTFDDFMDRLCDLAPLPVDRDARRRWLQLARELHAISGA